MNKKYHDKLLYLRFSGVFALTLTAPLALSAKDAAGGQKVENVSQQVDLKSSEAAAQKWLKQIDETDYADSWESGSLTLKLTVPKRHWIALMEQIRKPIGSLTSRNLVDQRTAADPKGLPQGEYMILVYRSSFSRKQSVNELVTLVKESDGTWRVLTYQVQ